MNATGSRPFASGDSPAPQCDASPITLIREVAWPGRVDFWAVAYVAYALWINDNGLFSWLGRILPFLRYKPPAGVKGDADILPHRRAVS